MKATADFLPIITTRSSFVQRQRYRDGRQVVFVISSLEQLLTDLLEVGRDDDEITVGKTEHDVSVTIPVRNILAQKRNILPIKHGIALKGKYTSEKGGAFRSM